MEQMEYEYIMHNWDMNIATFHSWVRLLCGFDEDHWLLCALSALVADSKSLQAWVDEFDGDINPEALVQTSMRFMESSVKRYMDDMFNVYKWLSKAKAV